MLNTSALSRIEFSAIIISETGKHCLFWSKLFHSPSHMLREAKKNQCMKPQISALLCFLIRGRTTRLALAYLSERHIHSTFAARHLCLHSKNYTRFSNVCANANADGHETSVYSRQTWLRFSFYVHEQLGMENYERCLQPLLHCQVLYFCKYLNKCGCSILTSFSLRARRCT